MTMQTIESHLVAEADRSRVVADVFGAAFPMRFEPTVYGFASRLSPEYRGGYWQFYLLDNGGFYMAPEDDVGFQVTCENGFDGHMSADAFGITACLYAYSHLAFESDALSFLCAKHYHLLRGVALEHREAEAIFAAID